MKIPRSKLPFCVKHHKILYREEILFDVMLTISKFQHVWPSFPKSCRPTLWYIYFDTHLNRPRTESKSFSVMRVWTYCQGSDSPLYAIQAEMWIIYHLPSSQKDLQPNRNKTGLGYWDKNEKSKTSNVMHWYFHELNIPCLFISQSLWAESSYLLDFWVSV